MENQCSGSNRCQNVCIFVCCSTLLCGKHFKTHKSIEKKHKNELALNTNPEFKELLLQEIKNFSNEAQIKYILLSEEICQKSEKVCIQYMEVLHEIIIAQNKAQNIQELIENPKKLIGSKEKDEIEAFAIDILHNDKFFERFVLDTDEKPQNDLEIFKEKHEKNKEFLDKNLEEKAKLEQIILEVNQKLEDSLKKNEEFVKAQQELEQKVKLCDEIIAEKQNEISRLEKIFEEITQKNKEAQLKLEEKIKMVFSLQSKNDRTTKMIKEKEDLLLETSEQLKKIVEENEKNLIEIEKLKKASLETSKKQKIVEENEKKLVVANKKQKVAEEKAIEKSKIAEEYEKKLDAVSQKLDLVSQKLKNAEKIASKKQKIFEENEKKLKAAEEKANLEASEKLKIMEEIEKKLAVANKKLKVAEEKASLEASEKLKIMEENKKKLDAVYQKLKVAEENEKQLADASKKLKVVEEIAKNEVDKIKNPEEKVLELENKYSNLEKEFNILNKGFNEALKNICSLEDEKERNLKTIQELKEKKEEEIKQLNEKSNSNAEKKHLSHTSKGQSFDNLDPTKKIAIGGPPLLNIISKQSTNPESQKILSNEMSRLISEKKSLEIKTESQKCKIEHLKGQLKKESENYQLLLEKTKKEFTEKIEDLETQLKYEAENNKSMLNQKTFEIEIIHNELHSLESIIIEKKLLGDFIYKKISYECGLTENIESHEFSCHDGCLLQINHSTGFYDLVNKCKLYIDANAIRLYNKNYILLNTLAHTANDFLWLLSSPQSQRFLVFIYQTSICIYEFTGSQIKKCTQYVQSNIRNVFFCEFCGISITIDSSYIYITNINHENSIPIVEEYSYEKLDQILKKFKINS
ncbi:hypothetical protein SteCoe_32842 [Stentor coeruleus]|uniref:Uncharacterized protein n=1 Tax=Stentor coeruleus TaxID=5963 RepID=A0A1R2AY31_9CILI|nr:hypothetical protein SteCoe_32842 [Stentor coeruleus]